MLVHHSQLPAWPRSTSDDPYFGPWKILSVDGHGITVRCRPRLGWTLVCAAQQLKHYYDPEDLCGEEWELNDEKGAALDPQGTASPIEVEGELPDMNAEEIAKEGFYMVNTPTARPNRAIGHTLVVNHVCNRGDVLCSSPTTPKISPNAFCPFLKPLRNAPRFRHHAQYITLFFKVLAVYNVPMNQ